MVQIQRSYLSWQQSYFNFNYNIFKYFSQNALSLQTQAKNHALKRKKNLFAFLQYTKTGKKRFLGTVKKVTKFKCFFVD
jgi:hypothetical protein